jgi:hypothetical protein
MSCRSMLNRVRRPFAGAVVTGALVFAALATAAPAQAAPLGSGQGTGSDVLSVSATAAPEGPSTRALCQTPTRYSNAVTWNCTVFSGQYIEAWMTCGGVTYYSGLIGEGSWYIVGVCPAGTLREDEGIIYY